MIVEAPSERSSELSAALGRSEVYVTKMAADEMSLERRNLRSTRPEQPLDPLEQRRFDYGGKSVFHTYRVHTGITLIAPFHTPCQTSSIRLVHQNLVNADLAPPLPLGRWNAQGIKVVDDLFHADPLRTPYPQGEKKVGPRLPGPGAAPRPRPAFAVGLPALRLCYCPTGRLGGRSLCCAPKRGGLSGRVTPSVPCKRQSGGPMANGWRPRDFLPPPPLFAHIRCSNPRSSGPQYRAATATQ